MLESVVGSIRELKQTLAVLQPGVEQRGERRPSLPPPEFAALCRITHAYVSLEADLAELRELERGIQRANVPVLEDLPAHRRFLAVAEQDLLKLKSKQLKRLSRRLGEYLHVRTERTLRTLAEVGRVLRATWIAL